MLVGTEANVIDVQIPTCTSTEDAQTYGQNILATLCNWQYQPYTATGAKINPAAQLGDGVTIHGHYSTLFSRRFDVRGVLPNQSAEAPSEEEVNSEYTYVSGRDRKQNRNYKRLEAQMESEFSVLTGEIAAKVSKQSPSGQTSFAFSLVDTGHTWYANGNEIFRLDATGAHVKGEITAYSGVIGDCVIENGVLKVGSANVDSLQIGNNFSVDVNGNMTANNATITGTLLVGGSYISAADMYTGASQAAASYGGWNAAYDSACTTGGYCYGGSGYGYSYNLATVSGTMNYPTNFKCGHLYAALGAQVGSYSLGTTTLNYLDHNGAARTLRVWAAQ